MKCSNAWWQPYFKVLIITIISFSGISGIYSFLSRSGELKLLSDSTKVNIWNDRSYQGIYCHSDRPINGDIDCNEVAQGMVYNITMNPSWDCHSRLNYSNLFIFENQHFTLIFGLLISFAFISAFFTIIHDWRLIKHRQDITKMTDWFPNHDDGLLFDYMCCWKCCGSNNKTKKEATNSAQDPECCNRACIALIIWMVVSIITAPLIVGAALLQAIIIPLTFILLRPFYCCSKSSWTRFMDFNGNLCEISYLWLGIAKFGLMIMTILLTFYAFTGLDVLLGKFSQLYSSDSCTCYCHYVLPATNFYGLMIVTYLLMINILSFLYQHGFKSIPYKLDYLLTKKYIQPMNNNGNVLEILKMNPMQTILYQYKKNDIDMNVYKDMENEDNLLYTKESELCVNTRANHIDAHQPNQEDDEAYQYEYTGNKQGFFETKERTKHKNGGLCCSYVTMFMLGVLLMVFFTAIGFVAIGIQNANHWPHWLAVTIMWTGFTLASIISLFFAVVCCCCSR